MSVGFYDELNTHLAKFQTFLHRAQAGNYDIGTTYDRKQCRFLLYATSVMDDERMTTKLIDGCIKNQMWGLLVILIINNATHKGVAKSLIKRLDEIPEELRASIFSLVCFEYKWSNEDLNRIFIEEVKGYQKIYDKVTKLEDNPFTIYYPASWNESMEKAINNPCWFLTYEDAVAYSVYSKLYFSRNKMHLPDYTMFGKGEIHDISTIKTKIYAGKIRKKDVLAYLDSSDVVTEFMPQENIIQDKAVTDISVANPIEFEQDQIDFLEVLFSTREGFEDSLDKTDEIYKKIMANCEKAGLPEIVSEEVIQNKEMVDAKDISQLIRSRIRMPKGDALKIAKTIVKAENNAKWIYANSKGYRMRKGFYYRALCFTPFSNAIVVVIIHYMDGDEVELITTEEKLKKCENYTDIFAIDYQTEGKSLDECLEKCGTIAAQDENNKQTEVVKLIKEKLTKEEKEQIKQNYLSEVDEIFQEQIQSHKDEVESKVAENDKLRSIIEEKDKKIRELERQLSKKQALLDKQESVSILSLGDEKEKYEGETHAMVMSALRHELKNCERDSRRHDVIASVIDKNTEESDPISEKLKEIKQLTKGYRFASDISKGLEEQGFEVVPDGKHPKIKYPKDDRYQITAASTASDRRAGENLYGLIKKKFF